jgi:hypothetical protein
MTNFSDAFRGLWRKRGINIAEYECCEAELIRIHNGKVTSSFILAIVFLLLALTATYFEQYVGTVLFFALAINFNSKSNQHMLVAEILQYQSLIAKLVNRNYMNEDGYLDELEKTEDRLS